jgi:hypothetical protein
MLNRKIQKAIDEFNNSSIAKYYQEKGDKMASRVAVQKVIGHSQSTKKILSERAKIRKKKTIEQKVRSKKGKHIIKLLKENQLSITKMMEEVGCSWEFFYEIKTFFDGGILKRIEQPKGYKVEKSEVEKRKIAQKVQLESLNCKCPHCNHYSRTETTLENHIKNSHRKIYKNREREKKRFNRDSYMTPEQCRNWLWEMGFFRGYFDPKYICYVKNKGNLPKGFRTFPWISPGKEDSRFFNKKLVELDNKIESIREMNNNGFSLRNISKKLNIPLTTLTRIFKKNNIKSDFSVKEKQNKTHTINSTSKKGAKIKNFTFKDLKIHINKYKIKTTRQFKKSGFVVGLSTIKRKFPKFNWEEYKYKEPHEILIIKE